MDEELIKAIVRQCGNADMTFDSDAASDLETVVRFVGEQETLDNVNSALLEVRAAIDVTQLAQPGAADR